jgi:hypothetical protein
MIGGLLLVSLLLMALMQASPPAHAGALDTTVVFQQGLALANGAIYTGTQDAYIFNQEPGTAHDGVYLKTYRDSNKCILIRFDVSSIPQGAQVTSAKLELWVARRNNSTSAVVQLFGVLRPWQESTVTWNSPWSLAGCKGIGTDRAQDPAASTTLKNQDTWAAWQNAPLADLAGLVQTWVQDSSQNYGMLLVGVEVTSLSQEWQMYSSEWGSGPGQRPRLTVTYREGTPVPTSTRTHTPGPSRTSTATPTLTPVATGASVAGVTWQDANRNGVRDGGELPLPDVVVILRDVLGAEISRVRSAVDGSFEFRGLEPGSYRLSAEAPSGWVCTWPPGAGCMWVFSLVPRERQTGRDFGFAGLPTSTPTTTASATASATATSTVTPTGVGPPTETPRPTSTGPATATATQSATPTTSPTATLGPSPTATATPSGGLGDPIPVSCGQVYRGSTLGHAAVIQQYGCGDNGLLASEVVHVLRLDEGLDRLSINLDAGSLDLGLFLLGSPDPLDCLDNRASVSRNNVPAGTYYLVVDGYGASAGSYTLMIGCSTSSHETETPTSTTTATVTPTGWPTETPMPGPSSTPTATRTTSDGRTVYLPIVIRPPLAFYVDCGSSVDYVDNMGLTWSADRAYSAGSWGYVGESIAIPPSIRSIAGTPNPRLYQTARWAEDSFGYRFDVPNGKYRVSLYFAETYFAARGRRVFNVSIEMQPVLTNYDIVVEAGGWLIAHSETFEVSVSDGTLEVNLARGAVDFPMINVLRVVKIE